MRHRQPARQMPPSAAAVRPSRTAAASFPLLMSLLVLGSTISVHAEEVKIGNVLAPRAALNFKGNTAWPYGLCEVRHFAATNVVDVIFYFILFIERVHLGERRRRKCTHEYGSLHSLQFFCPSHPW